MSVTAAAKALILNTVINKSIDNINVISLQDAGGEYFRKEFQSVDVISTRERKYTFYLTEDEGNGNIKKMSLYGDGATTVLGTGTEMAEQDVDIEKTGTRSLLIYWNVNVRVVD